MKVYRFAMQVFLIVFWRRIFLPLSAFQNWYFLIPIFLFLTACESKFRPYPSTLNDLSQESVASESLLFCPKLNFNGIAVPGVNLLDKSLFTLQIDITGSFEGSQGWSNLSDNFDGMGVSLGILNQNLGSGSLQPLLIKMRNNHLNLLSSVFSSAQLESLLGMLKSWESVGIQKNSKAVLSPLDIVFSNPDLKNELELFSAESDSVEWAQKNLYKNGVFVPEWKQAFERMAGTREYIQYQVDSAYTIHKKADILASTFGLSQLKSFLTMFDFVTQNGGFYTEDIQLIKSYFQANSQLSEEQKLLKILEVRLARVLDRYKADVTARKRALIYGQGVVHGTHRQLEQEYCFSGRTNMLPHVTP